MKPTKFAIADLTIRLTVTRHVSQLHFQLECTTFFTSLKNSQQQNRQLVLRAYCPNIYAVSCSQRDLQIFFDALLTT